MATSKRRKPRKARKQVKQDRKYVKCKPRYVETPLYLIGPTVYSCELPPAPTGPGAYPPVLQPPARQSEPAHGSIVIGSPYEK